MSKYEIKITTPADVSGAQKTTEELKKLKGATEEAGNQTEKFTGRQRKLIDGFKALGHEIPIVGTLLNAAKNPFILLGTVAVVAITKIREGIARAKEEQRAYNAVVDNVRVGIDAYSDLKKAVDGVMESQKALAEQTNAANAALQQQIQLKEDIAEGEIKLLDAEEQRQAALIERDEKDPASRARKLRENELNFGGRKLAIRAALGKAQLGSVEQQIAQEKGLQLEAGESVPNEAGLRETVAGVATTKNELEQALRANRAAFRKAELARKVIRAGAGEISTEVSGPEFNELQEMGLVYEHYKGEFRYDVAGAQKKLPGLTAASDLTRDRVARLRGSLRAGLGSLPAGVASEADIGPYMSTAESKAAETMNASYEREQRLLRTRDSMMRQQANEQAIGGINQQTRRIKGDIAIQGAQGNQDRELLGTARGARDSTNASSSELLNLLQTIMKRNEEMKREIQDLHKRADRLQMDMQ